MAAPSPIKLNTSGGCPHGMPVGACPICSGGGGGGGAVAKKGEMSWEQCYSIGQMMKAQKQNAELNKQLNEQNILFSAQQARLNQNISQSPVMNFIANSVIAPVLTSISNISNKLQNLIKTPIVTIAGNIEKFIQNTKEKLINIMDKLTAMFGEKETSLKDTITRNLSRIKKKIFGFFEMIDGTMEQGEDEDRKALSEKDLVNLFKEYDLDERNIN